ncbi:uncharacterized protein YbjT (DUF2867 family) [Arthrobacter pascens]|uniref:SDR family oxidoreductase n=1 Tax=Arthrobacter pascens TaxID=1677 RepID=UPI0027950977|nr:LysR family transcriptional regulator [Arthrobacter pascens]MDQ0677316.1 uncharacterized protein YbjT (DUF2867 family) [Arthrobacter pascens]
MKVGVVGGTGLVGRKLVAPLEAEGHTALAASPSTGVDTWTGAGLAEALEGAAVVVDVSNPPSFDDSLEFFTQSTRNLLAAGEIAGVGHHVILSIVGIDRIPGNPYYVAKLAQEEAALAGPIPVTILRATQFFEFAAGLAALYGDGAVVRLSSEPVQPLAVDDVMAELAALATGEPAAGSATHELAGPEVLALDEFVRGVLSLPGTRGPWLRTQRPILSA